MNTPKEKNTSSSHDFAFKIMICILVAIFITTLFFIYLIVQQLNHFEKLSIKIEKAHDLQTSIYLKDKITTHIITTGVLTNDKTIKEEYAKQSLILINEINELNKLNISPESNNLSAAIEDVNSKITKIEYNVLNLIQSGKISDAKKLLFSSTYNDMEKLLNNHLDNYNRIIDNYYNTTLANFENHFYWLIFLMSVTFTASFLISIATLLRINHWRYILMKNLAYQQKIDAELLLAKKDLELRVNQRTQDLNTKNNELEKTLIQLSKMHEHLIQSEKMATIGQLSAGVAHEINNPLSYVMSNITTLKKRLQVLLELISLYQKCPDNSEKNTTAIEFQKKYNFENILTDFPCLFQETQEGLSRIKSIVANLSSFSSTAPEIKKEMDINQCLESAIEIVSNKIKSKINLYKEFHTLPNIIGAYHQLQMVFINLLVNAEEAIKDVGKVRIMTTLVDKNILITIEDTGVGIKKKNLSKLFTPFFSTKSVGGTGLGLFTAYGIIKNHGGDIEAKSVEGVGTKFTIILPINENKP